MTAELSISAETTNEHGLPRFVRLTVRSGAMESLGPFRRVPVFGPNDESMGVAEVPPECGVASLVLDGKTGRLCVRTTHPFGPPTSPTRCTINDTAWVKLTPEGFDIVKNDPVPRFLRNERGWHGFSICGLMEIFGPRTHMGEPQPFENNVIAIGHEPPQD